MGTFACGDKHRDPARKRGRGLRYYLQAPVTLLERKERKSIKIGKVVCHLTLSNIPGICDDYLFIS